MSKLRYFFSSLAIIAAVLLLDASAKYLTHLCIPKMNHQFLVYPYGGIPVFKDFFGIEFSVSHATNKGAAWGLFGSYQILLLLFRLILIAGLLVYLFYFRPPALKQIPLVLIAAGAIGNVVDFFIYGHVIDMFHVVLWGYDFPVFNVADSAISVGIIWLFLLSLFEKHE